MPAEAGRSTLGQASRENTGRYEWQRWGRQINDLAEHCAPIDDRQEARAVG